MAAVIEPRVRFFVTVARIHVYVSSSENTFHKGSKRLGQVAV